MSWFNVDKAWLAGILERRGKFFAVAELVGNAWDSGATVAEIELEALPNEGSPICRTPTRCLPSRRAPARQTSEAPKFGPPPRQKVT